MKMEGRTIWGGHQIEVQKDFMTDLLTIALTTDHMRDLTKVRDIKKMGDTQKMGDTRRMGGFKISEGGRTMILFEEVPACREGNWRSGCALDHREEDLIEELTKEVTQDNDWRSAITRGIVNHGSSLLHDTARLPRDLLSLRDENLQPSSQLK